jgi:hypothetical protein
MEEKVIFFGHLLMPECNKWLAAGLWTMSMRGMASTFAEAFEGCEKDVLAALGP